MKTFIFLILTYVLSFSLSAQLQTLQTITNRPESVVLLSDGSYLVSGKLPTDCEKQQLTLEYYTEDDKLIWFRIYPLLGDIKEQTYLHLLDNEIVINFIMNKATYAASVDFKSGNLKNIQETDSKNENTFFNAIALNSLDANEKPLKTSSLLSNGDIFYSFGEKFGILDKQKQVKEQWNYEGLKIIESLTMSGDSTLLLAGEVVSSLLEKENKQGYLALISTKDYDKVYWTKQFGSEFTNDSIVKVFQISDDEIGFIQSNENEYSWNIFSMKNNKVVESKPMGCLGVKISFLEIQKKGSKWVLLGIKNKQLIRLNL